MTYVALRDASQVSCELHACDYHVTVVCAFPLQNASADVEKMILGNKCDLQESRVVDQERGRVVSEGGRGGGRRGGKGSQVVDQEGEW